MAEINASTKLCPKCSVNKSSADFYIRKYRNNQLSAYCRLCTNATGKKWRAENLDRHKASIDAWKRNNPDRHAQNIAAWRERSKAHRAVTTRAWNERHPGFAADYGREWYEKNKEKKSGANKAWKKSNPDRLRESVAARRAAKKNATPCWANRSAILEFYEDAVRLTKETGYAWHVDHIVPLKSKFVCGLHCEANLQVIPWFENQTKFNSQWPDMAK